MSKADAFFTVGETTRRHATRAQNATTKREWRNDAGDTRRDYESLRKRRAVKKLLLRPRRAVCREESLGTPLE